MTEQELIDQLIDGGTPHADIDAMNVNPERKAYLHAEVNCWID